MQPDTTADVAAPGPHGGDAHRVARSLGVDAGAMLDLSMSLNPCAAPIERLVEPVLSSLRHYPDADAATRLLADTIGVDTDRVVLTNGGSEAIDLVGGLLGGTVEEPEFSLYPRTGGALWRSDPHNPSGVLWSSAVAADVWDEAFYPLATGRWTAGRRETTVGSLTKLFACPGLRIGYVVSDHADRLRATQPTWSVNSLALAALPALLASADLPDWQRRIAAQRDRLVDLFRTHGYEASSADAPWVLVGDASLRPRLARRGVVVRDCASFGMVDTVRVAVPDDAGMARLADALAAVGDSVS